MLYEKVKYSFFNFQKWYDYIYNHLQDGNEFVEIGTWTGASTLYFGELIKQGNKKITFTTIDTFKGSAEHQNHPLIQSDELLNTFLRNREPLKDHINVIVGDSKVVYKKFADGSLNALFLDGDHSHEGFRKDIEYWYPKVKKGGLVSGHDYMWGGKGVKPIIDAFADKPINHLKRQGVWWYEK